ncbi:MAG: hypothetical protein ACREGJ_00955 [Candidatus Saccharimonadales bacterium]
MTKATTITINGRLYDASTGMPVSQSAQKPIVKASTQTAQATVVQKRPPVKAFSDIGPSRAVTPTRPPVKTTAQAAAPVAKTATATLERPSHAVARAIHQQPQKSQTLYRKALKKPEAEAAPASSARSPLISRFGPFNKPARLAADMATTAKPEVVEPAEKATQLHPAVAKVLQKQAAKRQAEQPKAHSSKELKEMLIKERLAEVDEPKDAKKGFFARRPRLGTILASSLALLVLGGYITYMNLPNISMKVAASRAGIAASFPSYKPDGYSLNGPITYAPGEVTVAYKSNSNTEGFKLTQKASKWDSQALLDNYVMKQTDTYLTFQERGLTVYTFDNKAAWTNGGLLYTVEGKAGLSSDQILRLATSL